MHLRLPGGPPVAKRLEHRQQDEDDADVLLEALLEEEARQQHLRCHPARGGARWRRR